MTPRMYETRIKMVAISQVIIAHLRSRNLSPLRQSVYYYDSGATLFLSPFMIAEWRKPVLSGWATTWAVRA